MSLMKRIQYNNKITYEYNEAVLFGIERRENGLIYGWALAPS